MKNQLPAARSFGRTFRRAALALGLCAAAFASLAVTAPAQASDTQFMGYWINVNAATRGIVSFQIGGTPGALAVHAFGACSPSPCDWSITPLTTYGNNVSDPDHHFGAAVYNFGFATTILTFELVNSETMVVDSYDKFNDGSGRQNYHDRETFRKPRFRPLSVPMP